LVSRGNRKQRVGGENAKSRAVRKQTATWDYLRERANAFTVLEGTKTTRLKLGWDTFPIEKKTSEDSGTTSGTTIKKSEN